MSSTLTIASKKPVKIDYQIQKSIVPEKLTNSVALCLLLCTYDFIFQEKQRQQVTEKKAMKGRKQRNHTQTFRGKKKALYQSRSLEEEEVGLPNGALS